MSKIKTFIEDRNEAFASGDIDKIKAYCRKYEIEIPEDEEVFLAGVHKSVCNLYLLDDTPVTLEQFNKSFDWLKEHGYSPSITFDLRDITEDEEGEEGEKRMFRKLRDVPDCLGNIDGVDYDADIDVRITTNPKLREEVIKHLQGIDNYEKVETISLDKTYHVHKITSYGDPFDVWIINDLGEEEQFGEWIFEDID